MKRSTLSIFLLSPPLLAACDDPASVTDREPVRFRTCPPDCSGGDLNAPFLNTAVLGAHALSNLPLALDGQAENPGAALTLLGAEVLLDGVPTAVASLSSSAAGELSVVADAPGSPVLAGAALVGAAFEVELVPDDPAEAPVSGRIEIAGYTAQSGVVDPGVTLHRYTLVTDVAPDVSGHPQLGAAWALCAQDPETLSYDAVIHPGVALDPDTGTITAAPGQLVLGCLGGAVAKTQARLNVYYGGVSGRTMDAGQSSAYLHAWRAVIGGEVTTEPGRRVSIEDLALGLVHWDAQYELEAIYDEDGAACRGTRHRRFSDPATAIAGWSGLPACTAPYAAWGSVGVRVPPSP